MIQTVIPTEIEMSFPLSCILRHRSRALGVPGHRTFLHEDMFNMGDF